LKAKNTTNYDFSKPTKHTPLRFCLRVLRERKGKAKEGRGRKGREGRKEGKPSPCLGVKETNKERRWRAYVIILLFFRFFSYNEYIMLYIVIYLEIYSKQLIS